MRVTSNLQWPETPFARVDQFFGTDHQFIASLDVEWTKNYQIKNGSRPFCYSLVLLRLPEPGDSLSAYPTSFGFKSVYLSNPEEEPALIAELDRDLRGWLDSDSTLVGHQLSSDLTVVLNASAMKLPGVTGAYEQWKGRHVEQSRVFDTRYDIDHLPVGVSRRLVDVCADLKLDVKQPELARGSMTKIQREFVDKEVEQFREQLLTLNVRHSLSTAMVACLGLALVQPGSRNVNDLLHQELWDLVEYVRSDQFADLLSPEFRSLGDGAAR